MSGYIQGIRMSGCQFVRVYTGYHYVRVSGCQGVRVYTGYQDVRVSVC